MACPDDAEDVVQDVFLGACQGGPPRALLSTFPDAQRAFLECYREMGVIRRACKVAKVGRLSHYEWMEDNPEYRRAFAAVRCLTP